MKALKDEQYEVVHSLAKWKRLALARYEIPWGEGVYTDMVALRPDEESLSSGIHSVYVDQWDWERTMKKEERTTEFLQMIVRKIYATLLETEKVVCAKYGLTPFLPSEIHFVHTEELLKKYPNATREDRENSICREKGAVFLTGIGGELSDGSIHDGRAPDYDDWSTLAKDGLRGLNGDIMVWNPAMGRGFELSSMGIRVDSDALVRQLEIRGCTARKELYWHKQLLAGRLPQSIGGGIGQSRLCMLLLQKRHIGEVQSAAWPDADLPALEEQNITLL